MKRLIVIATLIAMPLMTAACNTFEGMGQDVQRGGEKLERTAEDAKKN